MGGCQPSFDRERPWFFGIIFQSKKHVQNEGVSFIENFKSQSKNDLLTICSNTPAAFFGLQTSDTPVLRITKGPQHAVPEAPARAEVQCTTSRRRCGHWGHPVMNQDQK